MSTFHHRYFGDLNALAEDTDVVWEKTFALNGATFDVSLWLGKNERLDDSMLDAFATLLEDLGALDAGARARLTAYLEEDRAFIDYHVEELEESDILDRLIDEAGGRAIETAAFVAAMRLNGIGLWVGMASSHVVMDYVIDPENSDQILAVKAARDGSVVAIDWES
ncbi:MAG: DUF2004 domain-containing protein [Lysobacter sp.]|nr:DUF2004 domain-containing protein [Lysobacter sp.]